MIANIIRGAVRSAIVVACLYSPLSHADTMEKTAYDAFGGKDGLMKVASLGIDHVLQDSRIRDRFTNANIPRLKVLLGVQFCALLDGPCQYTGKDMESAHRGMGLKDADFNALAEDFQVAMNELGVPFRYQNVLVAKLAAMEKPIVTR